MTNHTASPFLVRTSAKAYGRGYVYNAAYYFDAFEDARAFATGKVFACVENDRGDVLALTDIVGTFHHLRGGSFLV
jgi:hypothetical protein